MKKWFKNTFNILKEAGVNWNNDDAFALSASIAYYAIFSIPALLVIVITVAGIFFGPDAIEGKVYGELESIVGADSAKTVQDAIAASSEYGDKWYAIILSIATLIFGSTAVFFRLQKTLNLVWGLEPRPEKAFVKIIVDRATGLGVILIIGFLLLVSLVLTSLLSALSGWMMGFLPEFMRAVFFLLDFTISFAMITVLFAMIYKMLPDAEIRWRTVWTGAAVTTLLFLLGKFLLGLYFGYANPASTYGAAGSLVLLLLWINYSCLIIIFGAEFTEVYSRYYGHGIRPSKHAVFVKTVVAETNSHEEAAESKTAECETLEDQGIDPDAEPQEPK